MIRVDMMSALQGSELCKSEGDSFTFVLTLALVCTYHRKSVRLDIDMISFAQEVSPATVMDRSSPALIALAYENEEFLAQLLARLMAMLMAIGGISLGARYSLKVSVESAAYDTLSCIANFRRGGSP